MSPLVALGPAAPPAQTPTYQDIEDICISAVKEKDIEAKLAAVASEWTVQFLTFAQFKVQSNL